MWPVSVLDDCRIFEEKGKEAVEFIGEVGGAEDVDEAGEGGEAG